MNDIVAEANAVVETAGETVGSDLENDSLNPFSELNEDSTEDEGIEDSLGEGEDGEEEEELTPKEVEKEIKRLKKLSLKYNGKEYEEELPFDIPDTKEAREYMTRQLQMSKMGQHKAQELSSIEAEIREFVEQLRTNPRAVLSDPKIGIDLKEFAASIVEEELENAKKSPEQLEKEGLERELKELKSSREKEQEDFREKEMGRLQQQEFERYDALMTQAIEGSDLPKTPYVVKKMADYMIMALNKGIDATPADILPIVREEILGDVRSMFSVMDAEQLSSIIDKDSYDKVRKHKLSKGRKKKGAATAKKSTDVGAAAPKSEKKTGSDEKTFKDFFGV